MCQRSAEPVEGMNQQDPDLAFLDRIPQFVPAGSAVLRPRDADIDVLLYAFPTPILGKLAEVAELRIDGLVAGANASANCSPGIWRHCGLDRSVEQVRENVTLLNRGVKPATGVDQGPDQDTLSGGEWLFSLGRGDSSILAATQANDDWKAIRKIFLMRHKNNPA